MHTRTLKPTDSRRTLKDHIIAVYGKPMPEYDNIQAIDDRGILYDIYPSRDGWTKLQLNVLFPTLFEFLDKDCETSKDAWVQIGMERSLFVCKDIVPQFKASIDCLKNKNCWQDAFAHVIMTESFKQNQMIPDFAFKGVKNIETFYVPDGVKSIGRAAFMARDMKHIYIPESVDSIEELALTSCADLKTIHLGHHNPENIEEQIEYATCSTEESSMCDSESTCSAIWEFDFENIQLYVPDNSIDRYESDLNGVFGEFARILPESSFKRDQDGHAIDICKYDIDYLKRKIETGKPVDFLYFWGHNEHGEHVTRACLSQWYSCEFTIDGVTYNCAEQYMMAEKARIFGDELTLRNIRRTFDQKEIKDLGRKVRNFDPCKWDAVKQSVVIKGNMAKFSQNERLKRFILWTGDKILVEASPYDKIWGIGLKSTDDNVHDVNQWKGANLLGFALMTVRDNIKQQRIEQQWKINRRYR